MKQKLYYLLALTFLLLFGTGKNVVHAATETIFSAVPTSTTYSVPESSSDVEISSTYATVSGGTMYVTNGQTSAKDLITNSKFVFTNNNTFFKAVLNKALQVGDVITINYQGGVKNNVNKGVWISTASSRPSDAPAADISSSSDSYQDGTYTVTANDEYVGKTTFYFYRSAGATTYMSSVTITREVASAPVFSTNLPATATVGTGSTKAFTVASGNATSYQWYKGTSPTANHATDTAIDGATSASYTYTAPDAEGTEYIYCVATNGNGSTTSNVCTVTVAEFQTVTFGLTRPLTVDATDATKGTMGDNEWKTAGGTFTLAEEMGTGVTIDQQSRSYFIDDVTYTATRSYRKDVKLTDFDDTQFAGYSFVIPDGKKLDITQVDARFSDASSATWTWKIEVQDANRTTLWNTSNKSTSGNSTTTVSISDDALATKLAGLVSGTYYAKIYFYQGGSSKCNTIDLTFTGNLKDADATAPTVTIASEQVMIKDGENTITSIVQAYPEVTAYQWYSCDDANGTNPVAVEGQTTSTLTVTPSAVGTLYYYLAATNSAGTTNSNVCTVSVYAEAEFSDFAAILNNGTSTLITSDEIQNKSSVSFGISVDGEGNAVRVAADSPMAFATVSGKYHSEHGLENFRAVVKVPGNVKIKLGTCNWGGTVTIKNSSNETVATANTNNGTCYHGNTSANKVTVYYEGEATTLTIEGGKYVPFISIESVGNLSKYNVTFKNGEETVDSRTVYNDGIEAQAIGAMPSAAAVQGKQFIGWYTKTDGTGEFATASTVPTSDITYYANYVNLDIENGYVVVDNSGTNRRNGENFLGALAYANANASQNSPVKIFLKNGTYDLGDDAETTQLTGSYVSIIGESLDGTVITNVPTQEGLGTATLLYNKGQYNYLQDLTLHNNYPYGDATGRAASLKDEGNYTICNNVWLYSHQDTYYSHRDHSNFYFKGGKISGCVDYMCGQGRVYFDGVTLSNDNRGTTMTANSELYVFSNCTIENGGSTYNFGRAWSATADFGDPVCVFLYTTLMDDGSKLASTRWNPENMNTTYDERTGEYGTMNASGSNITPAENEVQFTYDENKVKKNGNRFNTILTAQQAATYTMEYTLGEWAATAASDVVQATVSNVKLNGNTLSWTGTSGAYLIENDGEFVALTDETSYTVNGPGNYTVRAANGRGGFGEAVETTSGKVTISYAIGTNTTSFSCTPSTTDDVITFAETPYTLVANPMALDAKANLSVKLTCGTSSEAAATVSFNVPAGYAFVPYTAKAKVQPVTKSAMVKLELKDANNTLSNDAASFKDGDINTATLTAAETKYYTGTVTLGIYCYDNDNLGYRLSTPITISGELVEIISTNPHGNASHVAGKALDFSGVEGLKAYVATAADGAGITLAEVTAVPAGTAFVVQATEKAEQKYYIPTTTEDVTLTVQNVFEGSATESTTTQDGYTYYALSKSKGMFAKVKAGVTIPAGKAFVKISNNVNAKETLMFFFDGETTGIVDVDAAEAKQNGVRKQFINGQLIITKGDRQYNAAGGEF